MALQSETRNITVRLLAPADIRFISVGTEKEEYAEGETVRLTFTIMNRGAGRADNPAIRVEDTDTGQGLVSITTRGLNPDEQFTAVPPYPTVGSMPNHDWRLTVIARNLG
jgi:hypothetical protein